MSTALAVAAVTQALKNLLADGVLDDHVSGSVGDVVITALPPDRILLDGANAKSQLNLFLYQVSENAAWRNMGMPSANAAGERINNQPLALDLHYLLTAYGVKELHTEILLGYGMQVLHETPVLSRSGLREALNGVQAEVPPDIPPQLKPIADSNLADQFELVKLTPEVLSTEEISRLWTAFGAKYRTSAAYVASCVLIQSTQPTKASKPVARPNLLVTPLQRPRIDDVQPSIVAVGQTLTLTGSQLWQPGTTSVQIANASIAPDAGATSQQLQVTVPNTLTAGVNTVSVMQNIDFQLGYGGVRPGPQSNTLAFMLVPTLTNVPAAVARGATLTLDVSPPVGFDQDVVVLLDDDALPVPPRPAPPGHPAATSTISVTVPGTGVNPGNKLVRIRVDGAESPLSPAQGPYTQPTVNVT